MNNSNKTTTKKKRRKAPKSRIYQNNNKSFLIDLITCFAFLNLDFIFLREGRDGRKLKEKRKLKRVLKGYVSSLSLVPRISS